MKKMVAVLAIVAMASLAQAAVVSSTVHSTDGNGLNGMIAVNDVISGLVATELPGDNGWHSATPPEPERLLAFTDDAGPISGLTGLLNDFPVSGQPTKRLQYDLAGPSYIGSIGVLTGNFGGDGRVFSTTVVKYSTDNGANWSELGYFQSDPSGTLNNSSNNGWQATYVTIADESRTTMLAGVTNLQFDIYGVDNTGGQMRDPFDGVNPFTGVDDFLSAPNTSPLLWELDVVVPEPASLVLLALGGLFLRRRTA